MVCFLHFTMIQLAHVIVPGYPRPLTQREVRSLFIFRDDEDRKKKARPFEISDMSPDSPEFSTNHHPDIE